MDIACEAPTGALYRYDADGRCARHEMRLRRHQRPDLVARRPHDVSSTTRSRAASMPMTSTRKTGTLSNQREWLRFARGDGLPGRHDDRRRRPDLDRALGRGLRELPRPAHGAELCRVELPTSHMTNCAFGGAELRTLFITSARIGPRAAATGGRSRWRAACSRSRSTARACRRTCFAVKKRSSDHAIARPSDRLAGPRRPAPGAGAAGSAAAVAAWQLDRPQGLFDLWRPWDGKTPDLCQLASFRDGSLVQPHQRRRLRARGPLPSDGSPIGPASPSPSTATAGCSPGAVAAGRRHDGDDAGVASLQGQPVRLRGGCRASAWSNGGLDQEAARAPSRAATPCPMASACTPGFRARRRTRLTAPVQGVWLCGDDPLPTAHTAGFSAPAGT